MKPVIEINDLSKRYKINDSADYITIREKLSAVFNKKTSTATDFWALQNITTSIKQGDRIGLIGRNAAGKSTLLKILSKITFPTTGEAIIRGRLASLLEVGTGFHQELTGRENIFLNGSILGLKRAAIQQQFDAIVDFSGTSQFLDTALKKYSSGMQLRLAFAVAAHLEPDILLIDEVLAVGDLEFQQKCIGKMQEVSNSEGRTIIFVSHNMAAVKQLCTKAMMLDGGKLIHEGDVQDCIELYQRGFKEMMIRKSDGYFDISHHPNKHAPTQGLLNVRVLINGQPAESLFPGDNLSLELEYFLDHRLHDAELGFVIRDSNNEPLMGLNNKHLGNAIHLKTNELAKATINIPAINIYAPGVYYIDLFLGDDNHFHEALYHCIDLTILERNVYSSGLPPDPGLNKTFVRDISIEA